MLALSTAEYDVSGTANNIFHLGTTQTDRKTCFKAGIGTSYDITKHAGIRFDYDLVFSVGDVRTTGRGDISLATLGAFYRF